MNFAKVGQKVSHPKHGAGKVTKLLGPNQDDGASIKLASGKVVRVNYDNADSVKGWKSVKEDASPSNVVKQLLGEEESQETPVQARANSISIAVDRLESVVERLSGFAPRGEERDGYHAIASRIERFSNELSDLVERFENEAMH
jgi:hypothetical protein